MAVKKRRRINVGRGRRTVLHDGVEKMNLPIRRGTIQLLSDRRTLFMVTNNARSSVKFPCDDDK